MSVKFTPVEFCHMGQIMRPGVNKCGVRFLSFADALWIQIKARALHLGAFELPSDALQKARQAVLQPSKGVLWWMLCCKGQSVWHEANWNVNALSNLSFLFDQTSVYFKYPHFKYLLTEITSTPLIYMLKAWPLHVFQFFYIQSPALHS